MEQDILKKIAMTVLKSMVILIGLVLLAGYITSMGQGTVSGNTARAMGGIVGNVMGIIVALALIILPAISIWRAYKKN